MKKIIIIFVVVLFLSGCAQERSWTYQAEPKVLGKPETNLNIAVLPMIDKRENKNTHAELLGFIPLFPYGWVNYEIAEASPFIKNLNPTEDFAKATAQELNNSGMFNEVFFSYKEGDGDYFILADINQTRIERKMYTYGLSGYGVYTWILGAPMGTDKNAVKITFKIYDKNYKEYFSKEYFVKNKEYAFFWPVLFAHNPVCKLDILFKDVIMQFKDDLRKELPNLKKKK